MGFGGGGSGGGAVSSVFTRIGAVVAQAGDYTAALVTNAADKSSASTQAFIATITSNGNIGGQRLLSSRAGATGAYIGRHDGGSPPNPSGGTSAGDWSTDFTTPGLWMTGAGGNPANDWINLLTLGTYVVHGFGGSGTFTPFMQAINNMNSLGGTSNFQLAGASASGSGNWLICARSDQSANNATIVPNGTDTINGSNTPVSLSPGQSFDLVSDGTSNWLLI